MTGYIETYSGKTYELPVLLQWSVSYGIGVPCDAYEVVVLFEKNMAAILSEAYRFRGVYDGEPVFYGVVDEYEIRLSERECVAVISGRGMAALLLDNEAEAAEYLSCSYRDILKNYVEPFGISCRREVEFPAVSGFVVSSGTSCMKVLSDFAAVSGGVVPRFSTEGVLILSDREGTRRKLDLSTGGYDLRWKDTRYGVISSVIVKNKALGTRVQVKNESFLKEGGTCRRVVNVPRTKGYDAMRYTGEYQIACSQEKRKICTVTVPALFAAYPGDVVEVDLPVLGKNGEYTVLNTEVWCEAESFGTRLSLREK